MEDNDQSFKIGELWLKTGQDGKKYMSGNIVLNESKIDIEIHKNTMKDKEQDPDYYVTAEEIPF